jgi:hypothetical protein
MIAGRKATVEVCASCTLKFPHERLATFSTSFGTDRTSQYRAIGTKRSVRIDPGYELASGLALHIRQGAKERTIRYKKPSG